MTASKPVALCTYLMPSGKLCRGIALKDQRYCRAHIRNHRLHERQRAENEALDRFIARVAAMDLPELLYTLHHRLEELNRAYSLRRFPEIRSLLIESMERLWKLKPIESDISSQLPQIQMSVPFEQLTPTQINQMLVNLMQSNT